MSRRPPRSTQSRSSAASDVYKRQPLYETELIEALYRLNSNLPEDAIKEAMFKLKHYENGELVQKNSVFMDYLQHGIEVRYFVKGKEHYAIVYLVDYENPDNNSFVAVSYTHLRAHETRHDLVCRLLLEKKKRINK